MQQPVLDDLLAAFEEARESVKSPMRRTDVEHVIRTLASRGKALGGYIRQLVRLVRLATLLSRHIYVEFFEAAARTASTRALGELIARKLVELRVSPQSVVLVNGRILFKEPAMWPEEGGIERFDLSLAQLPRLIALHQILCRFLHFPRLYDGRTLHRTDAKDDESGLLWPVVLETPTATADEVARRLHAALNAHLTRVLMSTTHASHQVQLITAYLASQSQTNRFGAVRTIGMIDNRLLFDFWETAALAGEEGFKLYRSAVTKMLRYRRALVTALAECGPTLAIGGGLQPGTVDLERQLLPGQSGLHGSADEQAAHPFDVGHWQSPMVVLAPLFKVVKVLNDTECQQLTNYLDGCSRGQDAEADDESPIGASLGQGATGIDFNLTLNREFTRPYGTALMGSDRFDLRFMRTLLRVEIFGPYQNTIRMRHGREPTDAAEAVLLGVSSNSYRQFLQTCEAIRDQLIRGMLASISILSSWEDATALLLVARLSERAVVEHFARLDETVDLRETDSVPDVLRAAIGARLRAAFEAPAGIENANVKMFVRRSKQALAQVRRKGFWPEDWQSNNDVRAAHAEAAAELIRLLDEIERLIAELARQDAAEPNTSPKRGSAPSGSALEQYAEQDKLAFTATFRRIYTVSMGPQS